jgi:hypothetical protein
LKTKAAQAGPIAQHDQGYLYAQFFYKSQKLFLLSKLHTSNGGTLLDLDQMKKYKSLLCGSSTPEPRTGTLNAAFSASLRIQFQSDQFGD